MDRFKFVDAASAARRHAYAPYSGFAVGAALLTPSGAIFAGTNVENAAYPTGICAEAGAISAMIASGERQIAEILVLGDGAALVTPCGACRQRIREFPGSGQNPCRRTLGPQGDIHARRAPARSLGPAES